jgi:hypothetical protein
VQNVCGHLCGRHPIASRNVSDGVEPGGEKKRSGDNVHVATVKPAIRCLNAALVT